MFDFLSPKNALTLPAFGLDISDLSLKLASLKRRGEQLRLESFGRASIPAGVLEKGEIKNQSELIKVLKLTLEEAKNRGLRTRYIIGSLPEEHAFIRVIQLPKMNLAEVAQAVRWEAEANIPLPLESVYLDYQVLPQSPANPDHLDVIISAAPKTLVDPYLNIFEKVGLKPIALEIESQAIARALLKNCQSEQPVLIIDLGASATSFIIFSGQAIRFTTTVSVSGSFLTEAIAKKLSVSQAEAEALKITTGLDKTKNEGRVYSALVPPLNALLTHIKTYLEFYPEHAEHEHDVQNPSIAKIILSGGEAALPGLVSFLSLELKIPVELGNPWINILTPPLKEIPELPFEQSLGYTTALGLALRGLD